MNNGTTITDLKPEFPLDAKLITDWNSIDWKVVIRHVNRLQTRIVKAIKQGKNKLAKRLTYLLTHSYYAKLLAVRQVVQNKGHKTPGVDGVLWLTPEEKLNAANSLTDKHYRAQPLRRILIEKKGKTTKRPLGIPTIHDRAMQALYALGLYPIAETCGDSHSFGFRMGRSAQDAIDYVFLVLSRKSSPEWIVDADIKGCFDNINHNWLVKNIPMDKSVLKQFLKAGFVFEGELFPTDSGTPQGGIISPILANMTLDGIQELLKNSFHRNKINLCRYADDMVITAPTKEIAKEILSKLEEFLQERGLELSKEKTHIVHISEGFDFLGWNVRKYKGKLIIKPSDKSIKNTEERLRQEILEKGKATEQRLLIRILNPILRGWSNYHRNVCSKQTFGKISNHLFQKLWTWAIRRHPNKGKKWIAQRYWLTEGKRHWVFKDEKSKEELFNIGGVKIIRRIHLKLDKNPFTDWQYFANRKEQLRNSV